MLFSRFRRKKKHTEDELLEKEENKYEELIDKRETRHHVVDLCEQLIDVAREYEDARSEYILVTKYLTDVQLIEDLPTSDREMLNDSAYNLARLNKTRDEFMKTEQKLSDSQFAQMQDMENEIPAAINRLKANEEYLGTIKKDLNFLAGEKTTWEIGKAEFKREQKQLRTISVGAMVLYGTSMVLLFLIYFYFEADISLALVLITFFAVIIGAFCFVRFQDAARGIKKCDSNRNHAVTLENRVKIKYVNMKNAVDYACEKFHVHNSDELNYNYETYLEMVRDRERFRRTSNELERYSKEFMYVLGKYEMYDRRVWLNYTNAIINKNDMVELKHDLLVRRQKLRTRMEYNINAITELRSDILLHRNELGDKVEQVNEILRKISQLNMTTD